MFIICLPDRILEEKKDRTKYMKWSIYLHSKVVLETFKHPQGGGSNSCSSKFLFYACFPYLFTYLLLLLLLFDNFNFEKSLQIFY